MTLVRTSAFPSLTGSSLFPDLFSDRFFFDSDWLKKVPLPPVNVKETDKTYELEVAVPGYNKNDFDVTVKDGILIISSEHESDREEKERDYTRREFNYSSFSRSFTLPEDASEDGIKARYESGILKVTVMKMATSKPEVKKTIQVS